VMMMVWKNTDPVIILIIMTLLGLGLLGILTTGYHLNENPDYFFNRQMLYIGIGLIALIISAQLNYNLYRFKTQVPFIAAISLLIAVYLLGHKSWLPLGAGFHIQPSEAAKIIIILYLSYIVSFDRPGGINFWKHSVPMMLTCGLLIVLTAFQPDFGTALVMTFLTVYLLLIGSIPISHLIIPVFFVIPIITSIPFIFPHVMWRIKYFMLILLPHQTPWEIGYHDLQLRLAIGSGGLCGSGFGNGFIKRSFLPASHTDSIFAVLIEEGGFLTGLAIICLFLALLFLGERTAKYSSDRFGAMLARGIVFYIVIQAFLNISVCLGLFPNTGVTLPLFSYGGSSIIVTLFSLGILVNISSQRIIVR